jgi:hypothetical protein
VATNTVTSFVIPTTTELQSVLKGVNDALMDVVTTANTKGGKLADTDLAVYFDDEYLQDGFGKDIGTAELATLLRGVAQDLKTFTVYRILSYDNVHKVIQIVAMFSWTQDGKTLLRLFDKGGSGLYFKLQKQQDGSVSCPCLIFGNQQIASVAVQGTTVNTMSGDSTNGVSQIFQLQVIAPTGTLTSDGVQATVGSMPPYTLTKWSNVLVDTITSAQKDVFTNLQDVTQTSFPLLGTSAAFTLNTVSGQPQTYSYPAKLEATTTEAIQITNLEGYTLADANLGNPLTVDWTLPTSFPIGRVELTGLVTAGGYVCKVYSRVLGPAATSGTITLPTTCQGNNVASGEIQVSVWGVNEEQTQVQYYFN